MFTKKLCQKTIDKLRSEQLFLEKIVPDIKLNKVFPAIRSGRVDFYHKGGKLFSYDNKFYTHKKYASAIKSPSEYITELDFRDKIEIVTNFSDGYEQIKGNCSLYAHDEDKGISRIYHKFPFTRSDLDVVVFDIEISFKAISKERYQDRIDILLFNKKTKQLRFYEAKHYSNQELWSIEGTLPKVVSQIKRYQDQIKDKGREIISQYCNQVRILNTLFECNLPEPESIDEKVTLLVFGYDAEQKKRLNKLLIQDNSLKDIQHYFKGDISTLSINNMWKAVKCF